MLAALRLLGHLLWPAARLNAGAHPAVLPLPLAAAAQVCQGNHERDWPADVSIPYRTIDSGGECGVPYERRFPMPSAGRDQPWYRCVRL